MSKHRAPESAATRLSVPVQCILLLVAFLSLVGFIMGVQALMGWS